MSTASRRLFAAAMVSVAGACASSSTTGPTTTAAAANPGTAADAASAALGGPKHGSPIASTKPSQSASANASFGLLPGVGMAPGASKPDVVADNEAGPPPACAKDEDCWSKTCCPAKAPEECVHASRARKCAIVDVQCTAAPIHYSCVCDGGVCRGRLAPP